MNKEYHNLVFNLGTGLATVIMSFLLSTYYNVIIAWALYYLINSFLDPLPWESCNNDWNSELCWNGTKFNNSVDQEDNNKISAPQEFYEYFFTLQMPIFTIIFIEVLCSHIF